MIELILEKLGTTAGKVVVFFCRFSTKQECLFNIQNKVVFFFSVCLMIFCSIKLSNG